MRQDERDDPILYKVVVNHEEVYSIWPVDREDPPGWRDAGKSGRRSECLAYIDEVWTDMRPLSLRQRMAEAARQPVRPRAERAAPEPAGDDLVQRLMQGEHPVEVSLRPLTSRERPSLASRERERPESLASRERERSESLASRERERPELASLQERLARSYVFLRFPGTRGGTELGVCLDPAASDWSRADFEAGTGTVHLVGRLTLDGVKVRCIADIGLPDLAGRARLAPDE